MEVKWSVLTIYNLVVFPLLFQMTH